MEIQQHNKIIAEFMGGVYLRKECPFDYHIIEEIKFNKGNHPHIPNADYSTTEQLVHLRYHCDWSWLMPVLERLQEVPIGKTEFIYPRTFGMRNEETNQFMVRLNGFSLHQADTLIEAVYSSILEVISQKLLK